MPGTANEGGATFRTAEKKLPACGQQPPVLMTGHLQPSFDDTHLNAITEVETVRLALGSHRRIFALDKFAQEPSW